MPAEIDFSKGERGKFHRAGAKLNMPIYLDAEVQDVLAEISTAKGQELSTLVNELLKKGIELIQMARN
ncbi:MAG: hypothetical protein D6160_17535 [Ketobacter sp.]|nr:MAG: hypothetical protein D6160_17535 [Ketobacter sp.]